MSYEDKRKPIIAARDAVNTELHDVLQQMIMKARTDDGEVMNRLRKRKIELVKEADHWNKKLVDLAHKYIGKPDRN